MSLRRKSFRDEADLRLFGEWIPDGSRVLDVGCGRGILLEHLVTQKRAFGVGVDNDPVKVAGCVERGVNVIQGDLHAVLREVPDASYDWVVCSRVLQELSNPAEVVLQALRIGRRVAVAFVNHGHWRNRLSMVRYGHRARNRLYPNPWYQSEPTNPVSITDFEEFCAHYGITVARRAYLAGDWKSPCRVLPKLLAGYGVYELVRSEK